MLHGWACDLGARKFWEARRGAGLPVLRGCLGGGGHLGRDRGSRKVSQARKGLLPGGSPPPEKRAPCLGLKCWVCWTGLSGLNNVWRIFWARLRGVGLPGRGIIPRGSLLLGISGFSGWSARCGSESVWRPTLRLRLRRTRGRRCFPATRTGFVPPPPGTVQSGPRR